MKLLIVAAGVIACATSAYAAETRTETWTCTHYSALGNGPTITRFEVSPPDLIDSESHQTYRIEKNNDYGIVATSSISDIEEGHKEPTVGAVSIVINKITGAFWRVSAIAAAGQPDAVNQAAHGWCLRIQSPNTRL
jgi:hypothetical protein